MNTDDHHKLVELLREFSTAMLITHHGEHRLRARPMAIADIEDSGKIWFLSGEETAKVHEIEEDTHVHLTLQKDRVIYLSISGMATLIHDRSKVHELWDNSFEIWFPEGMYDPSLVLISVEPIEAEYWDNHGWQRVKTLVRAAKSYVTGSSTAKEEQRPLHGTLHL
jgi:general stress protein 26